MLFSEFIVEVLQSYLWNSSWKILLQESFETSELTSKNKGKTTFVKLNLRLLSAAYLLFCVKYKTGRVVQDSESNIKYWRAII